MSSPYEIKRHSAHIPISDEQLAGFTREYAEHLVQPYCYCEDGMDGWDYCQHARDEGLTA